MFFCVKFYSSQEWGQSVDDLHVTNTIKIEISGPGEEMAHNLGTKRGDGKKKNPAHQTLGLSPPHR